DRVGVLGDPGLLGVIGADVGRQSPNRIQPLAGRLDRAWWQDAMGPGDLVGSTRVDVPPTEGELGLVQEQAGIETAGSDHRSAHALGWVAGESASDESVRRRASEPD